MACLSGDRKTDIIRAAAKVIGEWNTNKKIQEYIISATSVRDKNGLIIQAGVVCSIQLIAQTLGRYRERRLASGNNLRVLAREFLVACGNDTRLARRIIREYEVVA